jgi:hypothetical protein
MKHTGTIEFRCFRSSVDFGEILSCFSFAEKFIDAALNDGPPVEEIFYEYQFKFPQLIYNHELYSGWEKTKYDKSRGEKRREYYEVA